MFYLVKLNASEFGYVSMGACFEGTRELCAKRMTDLGHSKAEIARAFESIENDIESDLAARMTAMSLRKAEEGHSITRAA